MKNYFIVLSVWNVITMLVYGIDKLKAKKGKRRISEKTLVLLAFIFGGPGALFGMVLFNHKTSKMKFRVLVPLATLLSAMAVYYIIKTVFY